MQSPSDSDRSVCAAINRSMGCWSFSYPENILGLLFPESLIKKKTQSQNPIWSISVILYVRYIQLLSYGVFHTPKGKLYYHTEFLCISSVTFLFLLTSTWIIFVWLFLCCPSSSHFHFRKSYYEHCFNLWLCCYWRSLAS